MVNIIFGIVVFLSTGLAYGMVVEVQENKYVTLQCDFDAQYPAWTGPSGLANPLTVGRTIQEPGIEWVDNKNLYISKAMLKHNGNYTCSDVNGNSKIVELDVQYFSAWAEYSTATPENTKTTLTCMCHSNPRCRIDIKIGLPARTDTTSHGCRTDPSRENRTKCSLTSVMHVYKEDNGFDENSCPFTYKGSKVLTLSPKVKFLFPPDYVKITLKKEESKLNLTCSTDSSNPVSLLKWYRGTNSTAPSKNGEISSSYQSYVMDAKYNGKSITQSIDIARGGIHHDEKVFCCAEHRDQQYCSPFEIDTYTSGGSIVTAWITVFVVCVTLLTL